MSAIGDMLPVLGRVLGRRRWLGANEREIQDAIAEVLAAPIEPAPDCGFRVSREHVLGPPRLALVGAPVERNPLTLEPVVLGPAGIVRRDDVGRDRVDFAVVLECPRPNVIGIEVKIAGGTTEVVRQIQRYARHEEVGAIVLASTSTRLVTSMPKSLADKPIYGLHLRRM